MKTRFFTVALLVAVVGLSGCGKTKEKSNENEIATFQLGPSSIVWDINHSNGNISATFPKTQLSPPASEPGWAGWPTGSMATATVTLKHPKAKMEPDPTTTPINIENGSFKVIAEDGSPKTYNVRAQKGNPPN